jgi:mRNA interferase RelE/StbE
MTYELFLESRVVKFIKAAPPKHQKQIAEKIKSLGENPLPSDTKNLTGYHPYKPCDSGEYRIIYAVNETQKKVGIFLVGKRNDKNVYAAFKRLV